MTAATQLSVGLGGNGSSHGVAWCWDDGRVAVILSVAPHPDDEVVGAGPLALDLLAHGHQVHVACISLGRPDQHERRAAEARSAAVRAGWELHLPSEPVALSSGDDLVAAEGAATDLVGQLLDRLAVDIVVGPSPHDAHHGHEVVGRAVAALGTGRPGLRWWAWEVWGHLEVRNLAVPFDEAVLDQALDVLDRYERELARADYGEALVGAALQGSALGSEQVFGFGAERRWEEPYANVFCESVIEEGRWVHTAPRVLDPAHPLQGEIDRDRSSAWLTSPSPYRSPHRSG